MAKVMQFPQKIKVIDEDNASYEAAKKEIEQRTGVSFWEFLGFTGVKEEVDAKIDRSMRKETMRLATKIIEQ